MRLEEWKKIEFQRKKAELQRAKAAEAAEKVRQAEDLENRIQKALKRTVEPPSLPWTYQGIERICPKLAEHYKNREFAAALDALMEQKHKHIRSAYDWKPVGKAKHTLFSSLADHLLAKYRVPHMLWTAFYQNGRFRQHWIDMAVHVASGGSLYDWAKGYEFPAPMTRKVCHEFLRAPEPNSNIHKNLRAAQVLCLGGDKRLWHALEPTGWGQSLYGTSEEEFWSSVVQWLTKQAMMDTHQVRPIFDYIAFKIGQGEKWSVKGRTAVSVIRDMEGWHAELNKTKVAGHSVFQPSGIRGGIYEFMKKGAQGSYNEIWRIQEILTAKELLAEGKRQEHCVFSYARQIESHYCSIWTMTMENLEGNWAMLTVEVRNSDKTICQVRGRFNRFATPQERQILYRWATEAGLNTSF